jgi:hypothetical protein
MKMHRTLLFVLAGLILLNTGDQSGAGGDKDKGLKTPMSPAAPAATGQVEVRFTNGSVVVMTMLQDRFEIVTDYGKLSVPPRDIRSIEFGLHPTDEERRKIEQAIGNLGSSAHDERDTAVQDLIALGPLAYLRLQKAVTSTEPEVTRRAEAALKAIREKYSARLLRTREEDTVRTAKFSIVGRIVTPTFKARADDFGDLELKPGRLLAVRWLSADTKKEVVVDAATYGGPGNAKWLATGIRIEPHVGTRITATGQVDLLPQQGGQRLCGPDGNAGGAMMGGKARFFNPNNGQQGGELLGRIGETGPIVFIGSRHTLTAKTGGQLYLMIAQSPWGCPSTGEYRVTVASGLLFDDADADD